jgi:hypothetical protein
MSSDSHHNIVFCIGSFSTNTDTYPPISVLKPYFQSSSNKNYSLIKEDHIKYNHITSSRKTIQIDFIQIISLDKVNHICNCADCYFIFIDLTNVNSKDNLKEIFSYFEWHCSFDKKIFVLGIHTKQTDNKIENKIKVMIASKHKMKIKYFQLHIENTSQTETLLNNLIDEEIQKKLQKLKKQECEDNIDKYDDMSRSICEII